MMLRKVVQFPCVEVHIIVEHMVGRDSNRRLGRATCNKIACVVALSCPMDAYTMMQKALNHAAIHALASDVCTYHG
jgi:hypothetical protein